MKILVFSNMYPNKKYPYYGVFVKHFCNQLNSIGIEYKKICIYKSDTKIKKFYFYLKYWICSIYYILFTKYDLIYIHYASHSSLPILFINKYIKCPIITNVHGSDVVPENKIHQKMQKYTKKILNISEKIVVPSEYFKKYVSTKYNINLSKVFVYPSGGIDPNIFYCKNNKKNKLRDEITFALVGRISRGKGWDIYLEAIKIVISKGYSAKFLIIGDGSEKECMIKVIKRLGIEKFIEIDTFKTQDELNTLYNDKIDFLVFPTKREGESLGLVGIEAMACGVPVIASNFAAPGNYVIDGMNGYKFEMGNAVALSNIFIKIICNEYIYDNLSQGAISTSKKYLTDNVRRKLENILLGESCYE